MTDPEQDTSTPAPAPSGSSAVTVRQIVDDTPDPSHQHEHPQASPTIARLSPTLTLLIGLAAAVVAMAGLRTVSSILAPTFLAITLVIAVYPIYKRTARFLPKWAAATLLLFLLYGILVIFVGSLGLAVARLAETMPQYAGKFNSLLQDGIALAERLGLGRDQIEAQVKNFDYKQLTGLVQSLANTLSSTTSQILFLLTVMVFLTMDTVGFSDRLRAVHKDKPDVADALVDFGSRVRTYWVVSTIFGLIVAVLDVVALWIIGVPLAVTFGLFAFVTNYIPNIGFVLGLIPPALMALLHGGWVDMVIVIIAYSVLNFSIQSILQPKFTGDAVGINPTTAFLSLVFWSFIFGPLGALLAIPLTLLVKSLLLDRDPSAQWVNQFIKAGDKEDKFERAVEPEPGR